MRVGVWKSPCTALVPCDILRGKRAGRVHPGRSTYRMYRTLITELHQLLVGVEFESIWAPGTTQSCSSDVQRKREGCRQGREKYISFLLPPWVEFVNEWLARSPEQRRGMRMVSVRSPVTLPKSHSSAAAMNPNVHRMVRAAGTRGSGREQRSPPLACPSPGVDRGQSHLQFFAATAAAIHLAISGAPAWAMWDGKSAAIGSCALGDAGDECRRASLAQDQLGSYSSAKSNSSKLGNAASGVPVAELNSQYVLETRKLGDAIIKYATADPYDEERLALVKQLKADGPVWVSKYARGGSARTLSARRFYIAVDAVEGHLASNGLAPFPRNKLEKLKTDIEDTDRLLEQGK